MDRRALRLRGLEPCPAAARFNILLHERQPDSSALDFVARLQRLENLPDAVLELAWDAGAVVLYRELEELTIVVCSYTDERVGTARMLDRVGDEIQKDLLKGQSFCLEHRQAGRNVNDHSGRRTQHVDHLGR